MKTVVIVGNPKPQSRTAHAATLLAAALGGKDPYVIDVVDLGPGVLSWGDSTVEGAVRTAAEADLLIVASPTFKATYSGLLKVFLDQFAGGHGLEGCVTVPLMLGAGPVHAMAPEVHLKPLLVELGATCPAPGLYLSEQTYEDGAVISQFVERWGPSLTRLIDEKRAR
ncbi:NADPH-dependent FMN reductase [Aeromicrobium sp. Root344]|uniref:NADPH-dependent FMN reductase n=1 Tax=Aeromicrobium sp. Root344 TaxID=1736521 RepID=UPI0006F42B45|nr:NAD(P)H-dependent oxidoreductase [Aeromicrobium sp. Root344]KQV75378.1 NADPH-dependent FMN reductase [Aeromicrobium sp. Root344]